MSRGRIGVFPGEGRAINAKALNDRIAENVTAPVVAISPFAREVLEKQPFADLLHGRLRGRNQAAADQSDAQGSSDVQQHLFDGLLVGSFVDVAEKPPGLVHGKYGQHFEREFGMQMPQGGSKGRPLIAAGVRDIKRLQTAGRKPCVFARLSSTGIGSSGLSPPSARKNDVVGAVLQMRAPIRTATSSWRPSHGRS